LSINAVSTNIQFYSTQSQDRDVIPQIEGVISRFPSQMIPQPGIPAVARTYRTRTYSDVQQSNTGIA